MMDSGRVLKVEPNDFLTDQMHGVKDGRVN